jgi:hypothetical protein
VRCEHMSSFFRYSSASSVSSSSELSSSHPLLSSVMACHTPSAAVARESSKSSVDGTVCHASISSTRSALIDVYPAGIDVISSSCASLSTVDILPTTAAVNIPLPALSADAANIFSAVSALEEQPSHIHHLNKTGMTG